MRGKKNESSSVEISNAYEKAISFIHGYTTAKLEGFAFSLSISQEELAARLGTLLLSHSDREVLGTKDNLSVVPVKAAKSSKRKRKVAVDGKPRSKSPAKKVSGIKAYWAKMSPLQRKREMARRVKQNGTKTIAA